MLWFFVLSSIAVWLLLALQCQDKLICSLLRILFVWVEYQHHVHVLLFIVLHVKSYPQNMAFMHCHVYSFKPCPHPPKNAFVLA